MSTGPVASLFQAHSVLFQTDLTSFRNLLSILPFMRHAVQLFFRVFSDPLPTYYCPIPFRMAIRLLSGLPPNFYWFCCVSSVGPTAHSLLIQPWSDRHISNRTTTKSLSISPPGF